MARVVKYDVQSDLSGVEIAEGDRCIVRFEFDKKEGQDDKPNYIADLTAEEATALIEHTHAREAQRRERKPKENGEGDENGNGEDETTEPEETTEEPAPEKGGKGK